MADSIVIKGSPFDDFINGSDGPDVIEGLEGRDTLAGDSGDDTLAGNAGNDMLDGGAGADTFLFGRGDGQDTVFVYGPQTFGDSLALAAGIQVSDVDLLVDGADLIVKLRDSQDSVRLAGYFGQAWPDRPAVLFADGARWDAEVVGTKLQAWGTQLTGTEGDDALEGSLGDDTLVGVGGRDTLYGDAGRDLMDGGAGADTYLFGRGDGQDTVLAGWPEGMGQSDRLRFGAGIDMSNVSVVAEGGDLVLHLDGRSDSVRIAAYFNTYGQDRPLIEFADGSYWDGLAIDCKLSGAGDYLPGTPQDDALDGGAGDDQLFGQAGNDTLYGDAGQDLLDGGPGADTYVFGRGDGQDVVLIDPTWSDAGLTDTLQLGQGIGMADVDLAQQGPDLLLSLRGSQDSVRIAGYFSVGPDQAMRIRFADGGQWDARAVQGKLSASDDYLMGTPDSDVLVGGAGQDILVGTSGDDTLYGDAGADVMDGGLGGDTFLFGRGDGQDAIFMYNQDASADCLQLAADIAVPDVDVVQQGGDLVLRVRDTRDRVRLVDYFNMSAQTRPTVAFASGTVWDGLAIDLKINGMSINAWGTRADDALEGGRGDDILSGNDGDDTLYGDAGNDMLDGGAGMDTYLFGLGDGQDTVLAGPPAGFGRADRLRLGAGIAMSNVTVSAEVGDLILSIDGRSDSVRIRDYFYQYGMDRPRIEFADGSYWDGFAVDRKLQNNGDYLQGSPLDDVLDGGAGDDVIVGQDGNDSLYGDAGQDFMDGSAGADTYLFGRGDGQDTIAGAMTAWSGVGRDRLLLGQGMGMADIDLSQQGADLVLQRKGSTDSVRLLSYFDAPPPYRLNIEFADGSAWDGMSVDRLMSVSGGVVQAYPDGTALVGSQGQDTLMGTNGDDHLFGAGGNDLLDGQLGVDTFEFGRGSGSDTLMAMDNGSSDQPDLLNLGAGITPADVDLLADGGDLVLKLTGSTDQIRLAGYFNILPNGRPLVLFADGGQWDSQAVMRKLNPGNDVLSGYRSDDLLDGGAGNDTLWGDDGRDTLYGDSGNDLLDGGAGSDTYLFGLGDGSDTMLADPGYQKDHTDVLRLGAGITMADLVVSAQGGDLLLQLRNTADRALLAGYLAVPQVDRMSMQFADGFQWTGADVNRKLQNTADTLTGTAGADGLEGGLGDDMLQGLEGRDFLDGDQGNDLLDGGKGADTMAGGVGNDVYIVDDLGDVILEVSTGGDDLITASVDGVKMADNVERLNMANDGVFKASGNETRNTMKGNSLNNTLWGYGGNDSLVGLDGADSFYGGAGDDTLTGGYGGDSYMYQRGGGSDVIQDYDPNSTNLDKLVMEGNISADQLWLTRSANDLVVSVVGTLFKVRVANWYVSSAYRVESISAGGKTLSSGNVQQLVNAMATMTPQPLGQTTLSASYSQKLAGVMAAVWG